MRNTGHWIVLVLAGALSITPILQARPCTGDADVVGAYGWTGSRASQFATPPANPPVPTIAGSATPIGALAGGAANINAFAAVGRVYIDGNGGIFASSSATSAVLQVGKYSVNTDCTISASITDVFTPAGEPYLSPVQASATFQGMVVQSGGEILLAQTGSFTGTTLTLIKMKQYGGCAEDVLNGSFGLAATGLTSSLAADSDTKLVTPFNLAGRVVGDGSGKFVPDSLAEQSPLKGRQFTGIYSVGGDCTGAGTLIDSNGKSRKISFVVVNSGQGGNGAPDVLFAFTDANTSGSGRAVQQ